MTDPIDALNYIAKHARTNAQIRPDDRERLLPKIEQSIEAVRAALTEKVDRDALYMMGYEAAKEEWKQIVHDLEDENEVLRAALTEKTDVQCTMADAAIERLVENREKLGAVDVEGLHSDFCALLQVCSYIHPDSQHEYKRFVSTWLQSAHQRGLIGAPPEGYVLVPRMPTEAMLARAYDVKVGYDEFLSDTFSENIWMLEEFYKAMIAAAEEKNDA